MLVFMVYKPSPCGLEMRHQNKLTSDQKLVLFDTARANVLKIKEKFKERKINLILEKKEKLLRKQQLKKGAEVHQKKIVASNKLQDVGVRAWISVEEAEQQLFTCWHRWNFIDMFCV